MTKRPISGGVPALPENIIPFPRRSEGTDFEAIELKIDPVEQRKKWDVAFSSVHIAIRFCQFDHVQAEKSVRAMLESGTEIFDEMIEYHEEELTFLEGVVSVMRCAGARMQIARHRVQAKRRG